MMKKLPMIMLLVFGFFAFKTDKPAYLLFNQQGKLVKYKKLTEAAQKADIVFFGELHNNPISHVLQSDLTNDLFINKQGKITLGAEMFEADNQEALNLYLIDTLDKEALKTQARLWPNFSTDYAPLVDFAKTNKLPFVATNIPRKYASMVYKFGFEALDTLSNEVKAFIAPLPIAYDPELPGYKGMLEMMGGMSDHVTEKLPMAQAIKDATMAWFIHQHMQAGQTFIHYNGSYHSDRFEGIIWYLKRLNPTVKVLTISCIEADTMGKLPDESKGLADFIVSIPTTMTKTY